MDPNATLRRILDAARSNDRTEYIEACQDLASWLRSGGFPPSIPADALYIPGTNTAWSLLSPVPHEGDGWTLVRYDLNGKSLERFSLTSGQ